MDFYVKRQNFYNKLYSYINNNFSVCIYSHSWKGKTTFLKKEILPFEKKTIYLNLNQVFNIKDFANLVIKKTNKIFNRKINFYENNLDDLEYLKLAFLYPIFITQIENIKVNFIFDNFNRILDIQQKMKYNTKVLNLLSNLFYKTSINFIFVINNYDDLSIFKDRESTFYGFCNVISFDDLELEEVKETSEKYLNYHNYLMDDEIKNMLEKLYKNPYFLHYYIEKLILTQCNKKITQKLLNDEIKKKYSNKLDFLTGKKYLSDILYYIANDDDVYLTAINNLNLKQSNIKREINLLEDKNLVVNKTWATYKLNDELLKNYILENFNKKG